MFEYDFTDMALMNSYNLEEDIVANLKENGGNMLLKDLIVDYNDYEIRVSL